VANSPFRQIFWVLRGLLASHDPNIFSNIIYFQHSDSKSFDHYYQNTRICQVGQKFIVLVPFFTIPTTKFKLLHNSNFRVKNFFLGLVKIFEGLKYSGQVGFRKGRVIKTSIICWNSRLRRHHTGFGLMNHEAGNSNVYCGLH